MNEYDSGNENFMDRDPNVLDRTPSGLTSG